MFWIVASAGAVLASTCIAAAVFRTTHLGRRVDLLTWFLIGSGGLYGALWPIVFWASSSGHTIPYLEAASVLERHGMGITAMAFIGVGSACLGWKATPLRGYSVGLTRPAAALWPALLVSSAVFAVYVVGAGGIFRVLGADYVWAMRVGSPPPNPVSFLQPLNGMALFVSAAFVGALAAGERSSAVVLGAGTSIALSAVVLATWGGRAPMVTYVLLLALTAISARPIPQRKMLLVVCAILWTGLAGLIALTLMRGTGGDGIAALLASEFSYPFVSLSAWMDAGSGFRYFKDIVLAPVYVLPSSVWRRFVDAADIANTIMVVGSQKGENGNTSNIPVDLVTLGYMQAGAVGVAIVSAFFGAFLRALDWMISKAAYVGLKSAAYAYAASMVAATGILSLGPSDFVAKNLPAALAVGVALLVPRAVTLLRRKAGVT